MVRSHPGLEASGAAARESSRLRSTEDHERLAALVAERTAELEQANAELRLRITELRQAEHALHEGEKTYRELSDLLPLVVLETDEKGVLAFFNRKGIELTGYTQEEIDRGLDAFQLIAPEDRGRARANFRSMLSGDESTGTEYSALRKDGSSLPILLYSSAIVRDGRPVGLRAVALDITAQKQTEQALRTSEEQHRGMVENALDAVYAVSPDGLVTSLNPAFKTITGWSPSEWIGRPFAPIVHPDDLSQIAEALQQSARGASGPAREVRVLSKSGEYIDMEFAGVPLFHNGKLEGYLGIGRDVTERKRAEQARRETEERLHNVLDNSLDMIYRLDLRTSEYDFVSPACRQVLGHTPEEYTALGFQGGSEMVHPDDLPGLVDNMIRLLNPAEEPSARTVEYRLKHKELGYRWVSDYRSAAYDEQGAPIAVVGSLRDVTERRQAEEEVQNLYQHEKELRGQVEEEMKRRVELTRALAHELKTPLTSVLASSDLLASELHDESLQGLARNIRQGALNLNGRIDELLDLARGEVGMLELKPEPTDLSKLLREAADATAPLASTRNQSLVLALPLSLPLVRADATRVQQIVGNLLNNALKFTPVGGTVNLSAKKRGATVVIEVRDTGRGIPKDQHALMFEPYRRLQNGPSAGLGLGLALCKTLVELHGGQIWVRSTVGKGATFGFSLPVEDGGGRPSRRRDNGKRWKVLMIEDDEAIVKFVSVAFRMRWPEAGLISTASGEEGVRLVAKENPDLVMLDLGLPDTDGFEVLERLRHVSQVPVVIVSVKGEEADKARGFQMGADDYVVKPFKQAELLERLKAQIGGHAARKR